MTEQQHLQACEARYRLKVRAERARKYGMVKTKAWWSDTKKAILKQRGESGLRVLLENMKRESEK